jgi:hypothetical protein
MLSPQPKRNKFPSPPHPEPTADPFVQPSLDPPAEPMEDDPLLSETVINASIFVDEKPALPELPPSTPTIGGVAAPISLPSDPIKIILPVPLPEPKPLILENVEKWKFEQSKGDGVVRISPKLSPTLAPNKKGPYFFEGVNKGQGNGVYIYVTTERNGGMENHSSTKVTIPLPGVDSKAKKEKARKVLACCEAEMKEATDEKKYVGYCTKIISRVLLRIFFLSFFFFWGKLEKKNTIVELCGEGGCKRCGDFDNLYGKTDNHDAQAYAFEDLDRICQKFIPGMIFYFRRWQFGKR